MSISDKLRKTYGNIYLTLSFFLFGLFISVFWLIPILHDALIGFLLLIVAVGIVCFFIPIIQKAYDYFVDIRIEQIRKSDKAQLLRLDGLISLVLSFVYFSICVCSLWGFFIFLKTLGLISVVLFIFSFDMFQSSVIKACNKFMEIKEVLDEW